MEQVAAQNGRLIAVGYGEGALGEGVVHAARDEGRGIVGVHFADVHGLAAGKSADHRAGKGHAVVPDPAAKAEVAARGQGQKGHDDNGDDEGGFGLAGFLFLKPLGGGIVFHVGTSMGKLM